MQTHNSLRDGQALRRFDVTMFYQYYIRHDGGMQPAALSPVRKRRITYAVLFASVIGQRFVRIDNSINQLARSVNAGIATPEDAAQALFLLKEVYSLMGKETDMLITENFHCAILEIAACP